MHIRHCHGRLSLFALFTALLWANFVAQGIGEATHNDKDVGKGVQIGGSEYATEGGHRYADQDTMKDFVLSSELKSTPLHYDDIIESGSLDSGKFDDDLSDYKPADDELDEELPITADQPLLDENVSLRYLRLRECSRCRFSWQCRSRRCSHRRCISRTQSRRDRCFPKRRECAPCKRRTQCRSHTCLNGQCVVPKPGRIKRCFRRRLSQCSRCQSRRQCLSGICSHGLCVSSHPRSLAKCRQRRAPRPECGRCKLGIQCRSGHCSRRVCVNPSNRKRCFGNGRLCASCTRGSDCRTGICRGRICTTARRRSRARCLRRRKPDCARCISGRQCRSGKCSGGRCFNRHRRRACLGTQGLCTTCQRASQCRSRRCVVGRCVGRGLRAIHQCFRRCRLCQSGKQCLKGTVCHRIRHSSSGRCIKQVGLSQRCSSPCQPCVANARCVQGICRRRGPRTVHEAVGREGNQDEVAKKDFAKAVEELTLPGKKHD